MSFKTSIILCTYNEAKYLENTISKLEKNIPNLEIIIVDDNSTDGTKELLKNFMKILNLNTLNGSEILFDTLKDPIIREPSKRSK